MKNYKERAREKFEKFNEQYTIDEMALFKLEQKFLLEEEYKDIPEKETRRRNDIMGLLFKIDSGIRDHHYQEKSDIINWQEIIRKCVDNGVNIITVFKSQRGTGKTCAILKYIHANEIGMIVKISKNRFKFDRIKELGLDNFNHSKLISINNVRGSEFKILICDEEITMSEYDKLVEDNPCSTIIKLQQVD